MLCSMNFVKKILNGKVFRIVLGSCLQWYDFALYGFFSSIFAKLFFPSHDKYVALLASLSAFAVGFIARPFGSLIFGRLGDIYGRTYVLKLTPILITIPTLLLACIPTYAVIGFWAPLLLVLSRVMQGLFLGAEFGGNMVYLCESAPNKRFFLGSLGSCSGSIGILAASIVAHIVSYLPEPQLESYGWRLAFLLSVLPGICAWWLRRSITETPPYQALLAKGENTLTPFKDLLPQKRIFIVMLGILCFQASTFYYVFIFLPMYLTMNTGVTLNSSILMTSIVLIVRLLFTPIVGSIADRFSPLIIFHFIAVAFMLCAYGLAKTLCQGEYIFAPYMLLSLMTAISAGVVPGLVTQMFVTRSRYSLFSFTFNTGFGLFGGCTPALCVYLSKMHPDLPYVLPVVGGAIGLVAIQFYRRAIYFDPALYPKSA